MLLLVYFIRADVLVSRKEYKNLNLTRMGAADERVRNLSLVEKYHRLRFASIQESINRVSMQINEINRKILAAERSLEDQITELPPTLRNR